MRLIVTKLELGKISQDKSPFMEIEILGTQESSTSFIAGDFLSPICKFTDYNHISQGIYR